MGSFDPLIFLVPLVVVFLFPCHFSAASPVKLPKFLAALMVRVTQEKVTQGNQSQQKIQDIMNLAKRHETAAVLADLIHKDGAGSWPPRANHDIATWPTALRAYREIYDELAPQLAVATVTLDDDFNRARINAYRSRFLELLREKVDLSQVLILLRSAEAGRFEDFPRAVYNAFYCCIASCRHAVR